MGRKTVLRRLFKYLPISIESLAFASAIDGNAVAAPAPLEEVAFDMGQDAPAAVDQETGEIMDPTPAPAQIAHQPDPERIPQQTRQAEREPVQQGRHPDQAPVQQQSAEQWEPSPAELAEIAARERAEAGGLFDSADQQTSQPAPTGRRPRGSLSVE